MGDSSFASGFGSAFWQFSLKRVASFGSFAWKEIGLIWGVQDELHKLHRTLLKIQDLVDHVESSPLRFFGGSKAWQVWFEDLQKLAYDADSLLDHVSLHLYNYRKNLSIHTCQEKEVLSMILSSGQLDVPHEVNKMQEQLEVLGEQVKSLLEIESVKMGVHKCKTLERSGFSPCYSNNSSQLVDEQAVVGRQVDQEAVIGLLGENDDALSVISLVGMGGVGKTTLAQLVFQYKKADFDLKIWVSVSMDFDVRRITKSIIESATRQTCQLSELDSLQSELQQILISRGKFLLVLDDYWNESLDDWDLLSAPFRSASKGSKIIVTTRSNIVSAVVSSVEAYTVQALSDDDCWTLMKQRALSKRVENESLESLGKDIAKKCKGLPLAAKSLGSVLHRKSTDYEWLCIANSSLWDLPQDKNGVFPSLMLSYLHLPPHLQKCFAYCSIFPQNHTFEVKELVLLWMAEGFIQPQGDRRLEDIGGEYFNDLHMRSFFEQGTNSSNCTTYQIHNLIHDLAHLVSTNICFLVKHDRQHSYPLFGNACHLSLQYDNAQPLKLSASLKNERLRTFMVACKHGAPPGGQIDPEFFFNLKSLRVLYLCYIGLNELPHSINHLIYLRYLNLSGNHIEYLPRSVCKLVALQTLVLYNCPMLLELPKDMKNLSNLGHLMFDTGGKLSFLPPEFGELTNLQTLSAFIVRKKKGHGIEELEKMDLLRGTLCIKNIDKVSEEADASNAKMNMKKYLNKLELVWEELEDGLTQQVKAQRLEQQVNVLEKLEPHENLKELEIKNYSSIRCPKWLGDPCRKFTTIHLQGLGFCEALPSLGQLPFLKSLCLRDMKALVCVDQSFYGDVNGEKFPSLVHLEVRQMAQLLAWMVPYGISCMLRLTTLIIEDCPVLTGLPTSLQSIPNTNIRRCPLL